jgi:predicted hydrocarbon binding protein
MNFSRKELVQTEATMNQMRNAIFHLARLIDKNGKQDIKEILRRMGQNIAKTYINYWKPIEIITITNLKDIITTIYQKVLNNTPNVEIDESNKVITVRDNSCALCKYQYDDIEIAGCEILIGFVSEFINLISKESKDLSSIILKPNEVIESRAYGNKLCIQKYKYSKRREG